MGELTFGSVGAMTLFGKIPAKGSFVFGVGLQLGGFEIGVKVFSWV